MTTSSSLKPSLAGDGETTSTHKRKASIDEIEVDLGLPEPPSKKARRALKKGKPLPPKPASDDEGRSKRKEPTAKPAIGDASEDAVESALEDANGKKQKKEGKERSPYGVWIGNLPFTTTRAELREWLVARSGGAITAEAITRVHMPAPARERRKNRESNTGAKSRGGANGVKDGETEDVDGNAGAGGSSGGPTNKGFAYVDFATQVAQVAAIALSETDIGGRRLLIKDSGNFEGRPAAKDTTVDADAIDGAPAPNSRKGPNAKAAEGGANGDSTQSGSAAAVASRKIFVGNLGFITTEDDLWAHFAKCGAIEWVKVATFEDTGKCKGYGWVKFAEPAAAAWAVKGFVKIKEAAPQQQHADGEEEEEEEDEQEEADDNNGVNEQQQDEDSGQGRKKPSLPQPEASPATKVKTRKWWVNILKGRALKIELAEDDQVRYKKRFGKDATKRKHDGKGVPPVKHAAKTAAVDEANGIEESAATEAVEKPQPLSKEDVTVARLKGIAVKSQGTRTTFE